MPSDAALKIRLACGLLIKHCLCIMKTGSVNKLKARTIKVKLRKVLVILTAIGILASILSILPNELEGRRNRQVELAVEIGEVRQLAEDAGLTVLQTLNNLKNEGVTSLVIRETNIEAYAEIGRLSVFQGGEIINALKIGLLENPALQTLRDEGRINVAHTYIITEDRSLFERLVSRLGIVFGEQTGVVWHESPYIIEVKAAKATIHSIPVGIDSDDIDLIKGSGLRLVARPGNIFMGSEDSISKIFSEYAALPEGLLSTLLFEGVEVAGYPDHLDLVGKILHENNMRVGLVELVRRQHGIEELMRLTDYSGVTVHANLRDRPVSTIINAVKERGIRLLFLRFYIVQRPFAFENAVGFIAEVREGLARHGFYPGDAYPVNSDNENSLLHILSILGVAAASGLTVLEMKFNLSKRLILALCAGFIFLLALYMLSPEFALQGTAILASMVFSTLAFLSQLVNRLPRQVVPSAKFVALTLLRLFAATVLGGVMVAGLVSTQYFTSGTALFRGVTIANILPFIPIAWALYAKFAYPDSEWTFEAVLKKLAALVKAHVTWFSVIALGFGLIVVYVYMARMGHQSGMPLFPFEDEIRILLDDILLARPRTKEFAIAYPALVLGIVLFARGKKTVLTGILLVAGALAPISALNTFMHFANPTLLSSATLRTFNGLWLGTVIALFLVLMLPYASKIMKRWGFEGWL